MMWMDVNNRLKHLESNYCTNSDLNGGTKCKFQLYLVFITLVWKLASMARTGTRLFSYEINKTKKADVPSANIVLLTHIL